MSFPTPRFNIGDAVFFPTVMTTKASLPCPDCHGTGKWSVKSPAGLETTIPCPRCAQRYTSISRDIPSLEYTQYIASVEQRTIGSVRVDTHPFSADEMVQYMCRETGIGSGQVYQESKLFKTSEEAMEVAQRDADERNAKVTATAEQLRKIDMSGYSIDLAATKALRDGLFWGLYAYRSLHEGITEVLGDADGDLAEAVREAVEDNRKYVRKPELEAFLATALEAASSGDVSALRSAVDALPEFLRKPLTA